jgi:hypothetical protein
MDETEPMTSDNIWGRAPAAFFFVACLFVGGYFVYKALLIIIFLIGG